MSEELDTEDAMMAEARRRCFDTLAASESPLAGTVVVGYRICAAGVVTEVTVRTSTLSRPDLERCVLDVVRATVFAPYYTDRWVSLPIKFGPTPR